MSKSEEPGFHWRDLAEVGAGACILGFPVAATEEVWMLGAELSLGRVLMFAAVSILLLATVIYVIHRHKGRPLSHITFMRRVIGTYAATFAISALLLLGLDRLDLFQEPLVALKRTILIAFPASFAATFVDSFTNRS